MMNIVRRSFPFCVRRQLAAVEMLVTTQKCWFMCGRLAESQDGGRIGLPRGTELHVQLSAP
jgi:hypothetical protein